MKEIDLYTALSIMRKAVVPFMITFTELSLSQNEGGVLRTLSNQLVGPLKKNMNAKVMIGLRDQTTDVIRHIYIHSILEVLMGTGEHYKITLHEKIH